MIKTRFGLLQNLITAVAVCLVPGNGVLAQSFMLKPIRIVVPFPASGPSDFAGRVMSNRLPELFGQPVVFDNRSGAAGSVGAEIVAGAPPDGHTLLIANVGMLSIVPYLRKLPYDAEKDFAPITNLVSAPQWLVVHPSVPARDVKELIALAKAVPGQLNYGSSGVGQTSHLTAELFSNTVGVKIVHVAYKGATPAVTDVLGGQITMMFTSSIENLQLARTGRLRILAITSGKRSNATPDVPTMIEAGINDFEVMSWNGILAPAGTPREIIARLNRAFVKAIQSPDVRERVSAQGKFVVGDTPEQFSNYIRAESTRWARVIQGLGIKQ